MLLIELHSLHPKIILFEPVRTQATLWASSFEIFGNVKWYFCHGKGKSLWTRTLQYVCVCEREREKGYQLRKKEQKEEDNNYIFLRWNYAFFLPLTPDKVWHEMPCFPAQCEAGRTLRVGMSIPRHTWSHSGNWPFDCWALLMLPQPPYKILSLRAQAPTFISSL